MRRRMVWVTAAVAVLAGTGSPEAGFGADGPFDDARRAAERTSFEAVVAVQWVDHHGVHVTRLAVHARGGQAWVEGPGTLVAWPGVVGLVGVPPLAGKYDLVRGPGPTIAGRPTTLVVLEAGAGREELAVDESTGLVLRRETFAHSGRSVRVIVVEELRLDPSPVVAGRRRAPPRPPPSRSLLAASVPRAYRAPAGLAGGYVRVGAYEAGGAVHHIYSDGLHGLSLFSERGDVAWGDMPIGGRRARVGRHIGLRYTWPGGEALTWDAGAVVHTLVGDAPFEEVLAAARSLPQPDRLPLSSRLRRASRRLVEVLSGGR